MQDAIPYVQQSTPATMQFVGLHLKHVVKPKLSPGARHGIKALAFVGFGQNEIGRLLAEHLHKVCPEMSVLQLM